MITGNKGEWSEFYVLLSLLAQGKLFAADSNAQKIEDMYFPILNIERCEVKEREVKYSVENNTGKISIYLNGSHIGDIQQDELSQEARMLYSKIMEGGDRAFAIPDTEGIMNNLLCEKIAAPSTDKSDITLQIHDIQTGYSPVCGFSIKSELGSPPTLLNAGKTTNFIYKVNDITLEKACQINSINSRHKIIDRIHAIYEEGELEFLKTANNTFGANMQLIDSQLDEIIAEILLLYYRDNINDCISLIEKMEENNPLSFPREGFYRYKFKKFLAAIALGMIPSKMWDGYEEASGGYIIVNKTGDVVAYHIYNRNAFEDYLLQNTKLERASISRHGYATIYEHGGKLYIKLNLQIRFK